MRIQHLGVVLLALLVLPAIAAAEDRGSEYTGLLAKLKAGDTSVDYGRLRLSYMDSAERKHAKDTSKQEDAMLQALNAKQYAEALKNAEDVLANEYVNIDAHFVAYVANRELGAADKADFHRAVFRGLIDSIVHSGDGKAPESAWVVITVHEEYVVLRALGFQPSGQSLLSQGGHSYDVMKVKDDDGAEHTFYFNVDIPMSHYGF
ncbi:MAG: DUF4919 domain-containing protein [Terracidiphilus sp.]|jgi:hypothetical protein